MTAYDFICNGEMDVLEATVNARYALHALEAEPSARVVHTVLANSLRDAIGVIMRMGYRARRGTLTERLFHSYSR